MDQPGDRLQKVLAGAGVASRRRAEEMIVAGRVTVNGQVISQLGTRVGAEDRIAVDGKPISRTPRHTYILLNKPKGILSTARDERGRPTVLDLIESTARVYPVGRLDLDSEGLLLLTNDGELTFRVLHPRHELPREYEVWATPPANDEQLARLREGVEIEGWQVSPARVLRRPGGALSVVIHEGHKRQIRLMFATVGLQVTRLARVRLGPLTLGALKPGQWRELQPAELAALRAAAWGDEEPTAEKSTQPRRATASVPRPTTRRTLPRSTSRRRS